MEIKPIGTFDCAAIKNYDVPRQAFLNTNIGTVKLNTKSNFEQAIIDLKGFSHIWLIYLFNNQTWKPKVQTPRALKKKSVLSTRSPYRPNPIGMSLVELVEVNGLSLKIRNFDLLNETQIIDIKPYLQQADTIGEPTEGWLNSVEEFDIKFTDQFYKELIQQCDESPNKIISFINNQLKYCPIKHPNKRVKADHRESTFVLSYKYLRIVFFINKKIITIESIYDSQTK